MLSRKSELSIGAALPEPGVARGDVTFWIKRPVLHFVDPGSGAELIVLKYNIYNKSPDWHQHTEKFSNTVKVLLGDTSGTLFPKLHGFCKDIGGYHYIAVEFVAYDIDSLPVPQGFDHCVARAEQALELFVRLDEETHLHLADFKPGQWMARKDGSLLLQDVDDILPLRSKFPYPEQVEWLQGRMMGHLGISEETMQTAWNRHMFPRHQGSIRYDVVNTQLLLDNLGFRWSAHCAGGAVARDAFLACRRALVDWTMTLDDDWPSPRMVRDAFKQCATVGSFERSKRAPAPWRDGLEPDLAFRYVPKTACVRDYDDTSTARSSSVQWCGEGRSCCRSKGAQPCYYQAPEELCGARV
jgi:hypothetical protein